MIKNNKTDIIITNVQYIPSFYIKLFSIPTALLKGFKLRNDGLKLTLRKDNIYLRFGEIVKTTKGYLAGGNMQPRQMESSFITQDKIGY